ncbi:MAG: beta-N-acetylhexosaminidase [Thermodesulfobacteriota bacterium]|nr:beta-N-acetylhexosaminidase [Thermodesulfobacteriota bacterium]
MPENPYKYTFMAGQRLMAGFDGIGLNQDLRFLIDTLHVGGIILFARNLGTPEEIAALCRDAQAYAADCGLPPLFIAVDQEGGQVARLKAPFIQFAGNPVIHNHADARHFAAVTASELNRVGINMNMAPVLDVGDAIENSIMGKRVFPGGPDRVAELGCTVIDEMQANTIMAVGKHFPGIGRTTTDSHIDRPVLDTAADILQKTDLLPFQAAVTRNVAGIMLSHIVYAGIDPDWPASLSVAIAKTLLREQMKFNGVVFTDDLDMGAIKKHYDLETVIDRVVAADIDVALICHKGPGREDAFESFCRHAGAAPDIRKRFQDAVDRILTLKTRFLRYHDQ